MELLLPLVVAVFARIQNGNTIKALFQARLHPAVDFSSYPFLPVSLDRAFETLARRYRESVVLQVVLSIEKFLPLAPDVPGCSKNSLQIRSAAQSLLSV